MGAGGGEGIFRLILLEWVASRRGGSGERLVNGWAHGWVCESGVVGAEDRRLRDTLRIRTLWPLLAELGGTSAPPGRAFAEPRAHAYVYQSSRSLSWQVDAGTGLDRL